MNAHDDYRLQMAHMKLNELRREADNYRLARSLSAGKTRRWFSFGTRMRARSAARRSPASPVMTEPVRLPHRMPGGDQDLRRSA